MPNKDPEKRKKYLREYMRRWRLNDPEREKARNAKYAAKNPEKIKARHKLYHEAHRVELINKRIIRGLSYALGVSVNDIPIDLIETKLAVTKVTRKLKELLK